VTIPAERLAARAANWARSEPAVRAAVVYGSVAHGTAGERSDLDLIIVAEPGQRDALWARRARISELILGRPAAWSQEPSWQRPFRYQSWDDELVELDLTLDEERVAPWAALLRGFAVLVDKAGVAGQLIRTWPAGRVRSSMRLPWTAAPGCGSATCTAGWRTASRGWSATACWTP
jgi:predicted nucleotidyltransferase